MKQHYFNLFLLSLFSLSAHAQNWPIETLADNIIGAWTRAADFDQDGDPDILVQSGDTIFWYENLRPGWTPHIIDLTFKNSAYGYVDVVDIDLDGDPDVLKVPTPGDGGDPLTWNENKSNGTEWTKHHITTSGGSIGWMHSSWGDLDQDGDLDLVVPEIDFQNMTSVANLYWLENINNTSFWVMHQLRSGNHMYSSVADMDGDGDLDIVASQNGVFWLENNLPSSSWKKHAIGSGTTFAHFSGFIADLTGDGSPDVISAGPSPGNGGLVLYSNPDWQQTHIKQLPHGFLSHGAIGDIDGDGDLDIPYAGVGGFSQALGWAENQDNGTMWVSHDITAPTWLQMIPTGVADIDGDGDQDIVSLTFNGVTGIGSALWAANSQISTAVYEPRPGSDTPRLEIWPNPFAIAVTIGYQLPDAGPVRVVVRDLLGRPIRAMTVARRQAGAHQLEWDGKTDSGRRVPKGIYVVQLETKGGVASRQVIYIGN